MINPHIHNVKTTIFGIRRDFEEIRFRTPKGVVQAAMHIRGYAQDICPVDTGNLKASAYVVWSKGYDRKGRWSRKNSKYDHKPKDIDRMKKDHKKVTAEHRSFIAGQRNVIIGFSAYYALFAHEENHDVGEKKFLEKAWRRKRKEALEIVNKAVTGAK